MNSNRLLGGGAPESLMMVCWPPSSLHVALVNPVRRFERDNIHKVDSLPKQQFHLR